MNRQTWMSIVLMMMLAACHKEQPKTGIQFADEQMQRKWDQIQHSVLSADVSDYKQLPEIIPVWLALGHQQKAQQKIEYIAGQTEQLQPSDTLARMVYSVSTFVNKEEWMQQYANPIICKCAEYYMTDGQNQTTTNHNARYCYELMVMTNNDENGDYARLLADIRNWLSASEKKNTETEIWMKNINKRPTDLTDKALAAQAVINSLVYDNDGQLEIVKCYPWKGSVCFNDIYSGLGVKVSGTVDDKQHVNITMEAWRDADFMMMGERFQMKKGQKAERSFIRRI